MRFRTLLFLSLALGLLGGASVAHEKKGKQPKKIDPHWMSYISHKSHRSPKGPWTTDRHEDHKEKKHHKKGEVYDFSVTALRGPSATDVYVSIETDDPEKFPIPEEFEKLQIKILNKKGKAVGVKNFRDVTITDGEAVVSVPDLYPLMQITVKAEVKIRRKKEEVLRDSATVLFRPDLIVQQVHSPEQIAPNTLFNIQAEIKEVKLQNDVTANVSLYEGNTVLSTASGVYVPAGDQVTVLFKAVTFDVEGPHNLSIKISDAFPDEYDTDNNEFAFSVLVTNPVEPVNYTLSYSYETQAVAFGFSDCGTIAVTTNYWRFTSWDMNTELPFATDSPIDSIRWEAVSGNGSLTHGFVSEWDASESNGGVDNYSAYIEDDDGSNLYLTVYADNNTGQSTLSLLKTANNIFYVQIHGVDTTIVYEDNEQQRSHQGELVEFLEVRVLFADDGRLAGGSARVNMASSNIAFDDYGFLDESNPSCPYQFVYTIRDESSYASILGMTNAAVLPTGSLKGTSPTLALANVDAPSLPLNTDLVQNYPNPFNPSTNIQFTVDHSGPAVLKVYDMLGKEVAELYRGDAEEGRTYRFTFQAANFASGMYYAKLEAGGRQYTKKMILMK